MNLSSYVPEWADAKLVSICLKVSSPYMPKNTTQVSKTTWNRRPKAFQSYNNKIEVCLDKEFKEGILKSIVLQYIVWDGKKMKNLESGFENNY